MNSKLSGNRHWVMGVMLVVLALLGNRHCWAEGAPYLVKSVNTMPITSEDARLDQFCLAGEILFFTAADDVNGAELWKTDGTAKGTVLVKDIFPGKNGSNPESLTAVGDLLYFMAEDLSFGGELWKSDGTAEGTVMVKDLLEGAQGAKPEHLTAMGVTLFFTVNDGVHGEELWKSNGTAEGTVLVKDIAGGGESSYPDELTVVSLGLDSVLLFAATNGKGGVELWKSDGSAKGTVLVKDINAGAGDSYPGYITPTPRGPIYFTADDGVNGKELWRTDGTAAGTTLIKDIRPGLDASYPGGMKAVGTSVFFTADDGVAGVELWKSDGSAAGTTRVKDISTGISNSYPGNLTVVGATLYFRATTSSYGAELWKSDGTGKGTVMVKDIMSGTVGSSPDYLTALGKTLYFSADDGVHGGELWKSDGTEIGTVMVQDLRPGADGGVAADLTVWGTKLFFQAWGQDSGGELWKSDGTSAGTALVKGIQQSRGDANIGAMVLCGGAAYFEAMNDAGNRELWKSDGTDAGTVLVKDIYPGGNPSSPHDLKALNTTLYFGASDDVHGDELWKSDGTEAGTVLIKDIAPGTANSRPTSFEILGGIVYFSANDGVHGREFWKTDGTEAGTTLVKDIYPGANNSAPAAPVAMGSAVYFAATNITTGYELWKSDGTEAGTVLVKDIRPGAVGSFSVPQLVVVGTELFFAASDGVNGGELWVSDGTEAGTRLVKDIYPGLPDSGPTKLAALGNKLFFQASDGTHGAELWVSDGTETGTVLVKDIIPGTPGVRLESLTVAGGLLYFPVDDGVNGRELWKSDGTEAGTTMVVDMVAGPGSPGFSDVYAANGELFFGAAADGAGYELWKSRGTAESTVRVSDIVPGQSGSSPEPMVQVGDNLLFTATDGDALSQIWGLSLKPASPTNPGATGQGLNTVTWTWNDNSFDETGYKIWVNSGSVTPTTLRKTTAADAVSWVHSGLTANTQYSVRMAAVNGAIESGKTPTYATWTLVEPVAGLTFSAIGVNSISVSASNTPSNLAEGASGIQFANSQAVTVSSWLKNTGPWVSGGLAPNTRYDFSAVSRNGAGMDAAPAAGFAYTLAASPTSPAVNGATATSLNVAVGSGDGNPSSTEYAIKCTTTTQWVQGNGSLGASAVYRTAAAWGTTVVAGLTAGRSHAFAVAARNGAGTVTAMGLGATLSTLAVTPNVVGQMQAAATTAITGAGLVVGTVIEEYHATIPSGQVISQAPVAGTQVPLGTTVNLVKSKGPAPVEYTTVPNVVGLTRTLATTAISSVGLVVGAIDQAYSASVVSGSVISQNPAASAQVSPGSAVALTVSKGPQPVSVPNVVGQQQTAAATAITGAGLVVGVVTETFSTSALSGSVISQNPAANELVSPGALVNLTVSRGPQMVSAPNVVGQVQAVGQTTISNAGLTVGVVEQAYSAAVPAGSIVSQNPAAGAQVALGSAVNLTVSKGPQPLSVPSVVGQTQAAATATITGAGLSAGAVSQEYHATVASGKVISQSPVAGALVSPGAAVALVVSKGPAPVGYVTVPNVVGVMQAAASTVITGAGLTLGAVTQAYNDTVPTGSVILQNPASGTQVAAGTAVLLTVSKGQQPLVPVPNVVGQTQTVAATTITGLGLVLGTTTQVYSATVPSGKVIAQTPEAGVQVGAGTSVNLTVSKGPQPVSVPNVTGLTQTAANIALTSAGLVLGTVTQAYSDTAVVGQVVSQAPATGASVAPGSAVNLTVSKGPQPAEGEVEGEGEDEGELEGESEGESVGQVTIPDVSAMTEEQATAALTGAGLQVNRVEEASSAVGAGLIVRQEPAAGAQVAAGASVTLVVSSGPEDTGCGCAGCKKGKGARTLEDLGKMLGDLFLLGLSFVTLQVLARRKP